MTVIACVPKEEAILLGAFQRSGDVPPSSPPLRRRASGGAAVRIGPGTVWLQEPFEGLPPDKILNRAVRPLLRMLTKAASRPVHYFGRDWIACEGRPVGIVAFSHEAKTGRGVFEAFVSARSLVTLGDRNSYRGKEPMTLDVDPERLVETAAVLEGELVDEEPPWQATVEEAIGLVAAGRDARGAMRVGGELMVSSDALAALEATLDVDAALGAPGVALFGVGSLDSIQEVLARARRERAT